MSFVVKYVPKYRGNGCQMWKSGTSGYLSSPEAVPSWDANALFRMDKAGPRPSRDMRETELKEKDKNRRFT